MPGAVAQASAGIANSAVPISAATVRLRMPRTPPTRVSIRPRFGGGKAARDGPARPNLESAAMPPLPAGRHQPELPRARGAGARALARARRLPRDAAPARGRAAVRLLRGPADRQRRARLPPRPVARLQGHLPPLQDDVRLPRAAQGGLGLPRAAGRAGGRAPARHQLQARDRASTGSPSSTSAAASRSSPTSRSGTG